MTRKILLVVLAFVAINGLFAQSGTLKGTVKDKDTKDPIPYTEIIVLSDVGQIVSKRTNFGGEYEINTIPVGRYTLSVVSVGYDPLEIKGFLVKADTVYYQHFELTPSTRQIDEVVQVAYKIPIIDKENFVVGPPINIERLERRLRRKINRGKSKNPGVPPRSKREIRQYWKKNNESIVYHVDGVRVSGVKEVNNDREIGTLKGIIVDKETDKLIPHAVVQLYQRGISKYESPADSDGNFSINKIEPGKYTLFVRLAGYEILKRKNFRIGSKKNRGRILMFKLTPSTDKIDEVVKIAYKIPIRYKENHVVGPPITPEQIEKMPGRRQITFGTGTLKGKVTDKSTGDPIPFATILIMDDGVQVKGTNSEFDGSYLFATALVGTYTLKVSRVGYNSHELSDFLIKADKVHFQNFELAPSTRQIDEVVKVAYKIPVIDRDNTQTGETITTEILEKGKHTLTYLPTHRLKGGNVYMVDGVRVSANDNYERYKVPKKSLLNSLAKFVFNILF
ncbi:carboxypeptidase regulatory-like domain-containing protein [Bacteroidota bacterium]